jgi:hypothetical protein
VRRLCVCVHGGATQLRRSVKRMNYYIDQSHE